MAVRLSVCNERGRCVRVKFALTSAGPNEAEIKVWEVQDLIDAIEEADSDLIDQLEMMHRERHPERYPRRRGEE